MTPRSPNASLSSGYHLSKDDFDLYHDLQNHETEYESLFEALGYKLKSDHRGFYYFLPPGAQPALNKTTRKMALIIFLMVEHLADDGRDPLSEVRDGEYELGKLAASLWEKDPDLLREGGLSSEEEVTNCLSKSFTKLGFAHAEGTMFRFRTPVVRFLDLCMELGRREKN